MYSLHFLVCVPSQWKAGHLYLVLGIFIGVLTRGALVWVPLMGIVLLSQGPDAQLVLLDCYLHGVPHSSAITVEAGRLRMEGAPISSAALHLYDCARFSGMSRKLFLMDLFSNDKFRLLILILPMLVLAGCTVTNCQVALNVLEGVNVIVRNNDLSFNEVAMVFDGHGVIQDNIFWGNLHRSTIDVSPEALQRIQVQCSPICATAGYLVT
jgi:hypothetical protein